MSCLLVGAACLAVGVTLGALLMYVAIQRATPPSGRHALRSSARTAGWHQEPEPDLGEPW